MSVNGKTPDRNGNVTVTLADTNDAYVKPAGGIPASDLASEVQESIGLVATAVSEARAASSGAQLARSDAQAARSDAQAARSDAQAARSDAQATGTEVQAVRAEVQTARAEVQTARAEAQDAKAVGLRLSSVLPEDASQDNKLADRGFVSRAVSDLLSDGKIKASLLPSYVDDVLEYDALGLFPSPGETGKIYVAKDTNKTYRWGGSSYVEVSAGVTTDATTSSSGLMSAADKEKLDGVAAGAEVNVIETVKVNGTALAVEGKAVNIDLSGKAGIGDLEAETSRARLMEARLAEAGAATVAALVALKASRPAFDDTAPLRPPYDSEVAWLEADGTQWLDTGLYLNAATDVVEMSGVVLSATPARIFGARLAVASLNISCGITDDARMIVDFNNGSYNSYRATAAANSTGAFTVTAGRDLRSIVIGGATVSSSASNSDAFTTAETCRVFDVAGNFLTPNRFVGRLASFKVWRNGELIMDLQPVRFTNRQDVSEGGAFDRVSGRILVNAGTGAFGIGADII